MRGIKNKRIVVTGANGFIGYHLTRRLIQEEAEVCALIHERDHRIRLLADRCSVARVGLPDGPALSGIVGEFGPQIVFHLAAKVDVRRSSSLIDEMMRVNFQGTVCLLDALSKVGCDCFVNTGTCEEYGDNPAPFREDLCPRPVSPYSLSKASTTLYCSMLARTRGYPIVTLRPFLTYGPLLTSGMLIPDTIAKALRKQDLKMTGGKQTREFNFVDDIVDGYLKAATTPEARGEVFNIGNGKEHAVKEVVMKILDMLGNPISPSIGALPYREGETWHFYCDNSKAQKVLKWSPKVGLDDGLRKTIDWFLENPDEWGN